MHGEATDEHLKEMKEERVRSKPAEFEVLDVYRCVIPSEYETWEGGVGGRERAKRY